MTLAPITPPSDAVVPYPLNQQCVATVYTTPHATPSHVLVAAPHPPPTERAAAWTRAVLEYTKPQAVIVMSTVEVCVGGGVLPFVVL